MCAATIHPLLRLAWLLLVRGLLVTVHPERFFLQHWGETAGEFLENEPSEPAATLPESNDNLKNPYLPQQ